MSRLLKHLPPLAVVLPLGGFVAGSPGDRCRGPTWSSTLGYLRKKFGSGTIATVRGMGYPFDG